MIGQIAIRVILGAAGVAVVLFLLSAAWAFVEAARLDLARRRILVDAGPSRARDPDSGRWEGEPATRIGSV